MVWEQRTGTIVMMTRLEERSRVRDLAVDPKSVQSSISYCVDLIVSTKQVLSEGAE